MYKLIYFYIALSGFRMKHFLYSTELIYFNSDSDREIFSSSSGDILLILLINE